MKSRVWCSLVGACLLAGSVSTQAGQFGDFTYESSGSGVTITGYTGPGGDVSIVETINGQPVTSIGASAFIDCHGLISVTIPDSVTSIGQGAFSGCTSLTSVTIPDSVSSIEDRAFSGCTSLISITIGSGVTNIGYEAFRECTSLTSVTIPDSVMGIGELAFYGCTSLTSVTISSSVTSIGGYAFSGGTSLTAFQVTALNPSYSSVDGVMFNKSQTELVLHPEGKTGHYSIPDSVTSIGDYAFYHCTSLTSVTIPDSVTRIGNSAFFYCTGLTSVTIPDSVTSIGNLAFYYCTGLTSVVIGNSVTSIGGQAFEGCTGLTSVVIPNSVTNIGEGAFRCYGLQAVYFYGDAPTIGPNAFRNTMATLFYLPGAAGWGATTAGRPTVQWNGLFGAQSLEMFAGLTIVGEIGKVYSIEYVTDVTEPAESDWRCLEYLQLPASPHLWADKSAPATGKRFYRAVAMEAPPNMVFIPPGTFRMGSPTNEVDREEDEGPQTDVIISRGFWMGKYEVTQGEYLEVMGNNPSYFNGVRDSGTDHGTDLSRPVEFGWYGNWDKTVAYCDALSQRERTAGRIAPNVVYRLPTEAEWEYACRARTSTRFSYGDDPGYKSLTDYAWYGAPLYTIGATHSVGQKLPNPWGLYDMHGNVWEWCQDSSGPYAGGIVIDPQNPSEEWWWSEHVLRGGDGSTDPDYCRSAYRTSYPVMDGDGYCGFRVVLAPGQ